MFIEHRQQIGPRVLPCNPRRRHELPVERQRIVKSPVLRSVLWPWLDVAANLAHERSVRGARQACGLGVSRKHRGYRVADEPGHYRERHEPDAQRDHDDRHELHHRQCVEQQLDPASAADGAHCGHSPEQSTPMSSSTATRSTSRYRRAIHQAGMYRHQWGRASSEPGWQCGHAYRTRRISRTRSALLGDRVSERAGREPACGNAIVRATSPSVPELSPVWTTRRGWDCPAASGTRVGPTVRAAIGVPAGNRAAARARGPACCGGLATGAD